MNIVFYTYPENTSKVAFTITDQSVDQLKQQGVIPGSSATLTKPYDEHIKSEEYAMLVHIDKVSFDNKTTPTKLIFDLEMLSMFYLNEYRQIRENVFKILDMYQLRAMVESKKEILDEIQIDKQILRDMPDNLDFSLAKSASEVLRVIPTSLTIDYEEKYRSKFKG